MFFVRREERNGIELRKLLSQKARRKEGVGLALFCPSKKGEGD